MFQKKCGGDAGHVGEAGFGKRAVCQPPSRRVSGGFPFRRSDTTHESISNRELEVLKLIASGKLLKEIGVKLALSEKTIATHRSRIEGKMGLTGHVDLKRYAMRRGLTCRLRLVRLSGDHPTQVTVINKLS